MQSALEDLTRNFREWRWKPLIWNNRKFQFWRHIANTSLARIGDNSACYYTCFGISYSLWLTKVIKASKLEMNHHPIEYLHENSMNAARRLFDQIWTRLIRFENNFKVNDFYIALIFIRKKKSIKYSCCTIIPGVPKKSILNLFRKKMK